MKTETERIWSPLDVGIVWVDSTDPSTPAEGTGMAVVLDERGGSDQPGNSDLVLATLNQPSSRCGWGLARVWVRTVERYAAWLHGREHTVAASPRALVNPLLGRALGRALAHEIGHYLLGTREHAAHGLMRAQFAPQDLLEDATGPLFTLHAQARAQLLACRTD